MEDFSLYNQEITSSIMTTLKEKYLQTEDAHRDCAIFSNEYVSSRLRDLIHIEDLRKAGTFFTGDKLAQDAIDRSDDFSETTVFLDPACGAGNLLLATTKHLRTCETLSQTLFTWGKVLHGLDLHKEFVEATKLRIIKEAVSRGVQVDERNLNKLLSLLPNIKIGNVFENSDLLSMIDVLIINPPFNLMETPNWCNWTSGKVNAAAIFFEFCLSNLNERTKVIAILPDVLRSGTRYQKWRNIISSRIQLEIINNGIFDKDTDINTFILHGIVSNNLLNDGWYEQNNSFKTLSQISVIRVGPLVPFRHNQQGTLHKYIHVKNIEPWTTVNVSSITDTRLFSGAYISPPFVVVRRNSRPDDKYRARASIIIGDNTVAVENHLLIIEPLNKTVKECENIVRILRQESTNTFLNNRIRCRHLTVSALKEIPIE